MSRRFCLIWSLLTSCCVALAAPTWAAHMELVNVNGAGEPVLGAREPALSSDARYVAFESAATELVPGDTNEANDVFLRDRLAGTTERLSLGDGGQQGNDHSGSLASQCLGVALSADGRYAAFISYADNLVPNDTNLVSDVFVRDRTAGTTQRVSVSSTGEQSDDWTYSVTISADGRYVAFASHARHLVSGDTNGLNDVFVRDLQTNTTERVSVNSDEEQGSGGSGYCQTGVISLSADGRYVAFESGAANLVPGDTNGAIDVFVRDRLAGTTERVSVSSAGEEGDSASASPVITPDGRFVAFVSWAANLVPGDTNDATDVFVHDRTTGTTARVSVSTSGEQNNSPNGVGSGGDLAISADGRYVAFTSTASNLVADDTNNQWDIFLRDRQTATTERMSVNDAGEEGNAGSKWAALSADGRYVAFHSLASNLVTPGTSASQNVFLRDREADPEQPTFDDVPSDYWAYDHVMALASAGIVAGYEDGGYHPEVAVTRDQMAVYISRARAGGDEHVPAPTTDPGFTDVDSDHWAYQYICYVVDQHIAAGYPEGDYRPDQEVTRDQMAVYVARAMVAPTTSVLDTYVPADPENFPDVPSDYWAYKYVEYCVEQAVVGGYPEGDYKPTVVVTRDQMAVYVSRAFDLLE